MPSFCCSSSLPSNPKLFSFNSWLKPHFRFPLRHYFRRVLSSPTTLADLLSPVPPCTGVLSGVFYGVARSLLGSGSGSGCPSKFFGSSVISASAASLFLLVPFGLFLVFPPLFRRRDGVLTVLGLVRRPMKLFSWWAWSNTSWIFVGAFRACRRVCFLLQWEPPVYLGVAGVRRALCFGYTSIHYRGWTGYTSILHLASASLSKFLEKSIQPPHLLLWCFNCCYCFVRPAPVIEGCFLEISFSDSFVSSSAWCPVTFVAAAQLWIVLSAHVVDSISCNISSHVSGVVQGVLSLICFIVIKDQDQGFNDFSYCRCVRITLFYQSICFYSVIDLVLDQGVLALVPPFVTFPPWRLI